MGTKKKQRSKATKERRGNLWQRIVESQKASPPPTPIDANDPNLLKITFYFCVTTRDDKRQIPMTADMRTTRDFLAKCEYEPNYMNNIIKEKGRTLMAAMRIPGAPQYECDCGEPSTSFEVTVKAALKTTSENPMVAFDAVPICGKPKCTIRAKQKVCEGRTTVSRLFKEKIVSTKVESTTLDCAHCHRIEEPGEKLDYACSRCKVVYYCSKECRLADWNARHREGCCKPKGDFEIIH